MENEETEIKAEETVSANDDHNIKKENSSGNKSDDSSSQNGSESSTKVGGIRLVSLSTLIDKPKAWVKEALMEPEIIELNSDDDSDDVVITECASSKDTNSKNTSETKRTDTLTDRFKSKFSAFNESLQKHNKQKKKASSDTVVQIKDHDVDVDNYKSCRVLLEKVSNLEKLKSKIKSKNNSSSSEDEEVPLSKLKPKKKPGKKSTSKSKQSTSSSNENDTDSSSSSSAEESDSENDEKLKKSKDKLDRKIGPKSSKKKTRNTKDSTKTTGIEVEKPEESNKKSTDSETIQEKKNSKTKKSVAFDLSSKTESKIDKTSKKSTDSDSDIVEEKKKSKSKTLRTKQKMNDSEIEEQQTDSKDNSESEFQEKKKQPTTTKGKKLKNTKSNDSESEISKNSDESDAKKTTKNSVKSKKLRNKKSTDATTTTAVVNSKIENPIATDSVESEFQEKKKPTKGKKLKNTRSDSVESENSKTSDKSESKKAATETVKSKTKPARNKKPTVEPEDVESEIEEEQTDSKDQNPLATDDDDDDSESKEEKKKPKGKKLKTKKSSTNDSESEVSNESETKKDTKSKSKKDSGSDEEDETHKKSKAEKSNGITKEKNQSKISRKKKTTVEESVEEESDSEMETIEEKNPDEVIENTVTKNDENDLKITIKRNKAAIPRKRVISSESDSEKSEKDAEKMSVSDENEETIVDPDEESEKPATTAVNKKKRTRVVTSDESEKDFYPTKSKLPEAENSSSEEKKSSEDEKEKKKVRRRIRTAKESNGSSSDDDNEENDGKGQRRKKIRKVLKHDSLSSKTKNATKEEMQRRKRIADRQKMYNEICKNHLLEKSALDKVVLDFDPEKKKDLIKVHPKLVATLKPHQANGIKFMWDCCFESLEHAKESKGSGCILAHCMGLGKTLQVVSLIHTLLTHEETGIKTVMVVCPLSTVLNWVNEFNIWLSKINGGNDVDVYEITKYKKMIDRSYKIKEWHDSGGVLVVGYEMFRNLSCTTNKRIRKPVLNRLQTGLVNPGPDLVVCDEGHLLKNEKARISVAMNKISSLRRIVLTGTPLQNNLKEYYCMIQFVKPNLLGTYKEYTNRFVNPIVNGQYIDSTPRDIEIMKRRSHVLHKLLDGVVQRRDYAVLAPFLPPKQEYVLYLTLHPLQEKLYEIYIQNYSKRSQQLTGGKAVALFSDFQELSRIWTHPRSLRFYSDKCEKERAKQMTDSDENSFICDDESDASTTPDSSSDDSDFNPKKKKPKKRRMTRAKAKEVNSDDESSANEADKNDDSDSDCKIIEEKKEEFNSDWWVKHVDDAVLEDITYSSKLMLFFKILKKCEEIGDKVLVFSQSLFSLDLIEYFLDKLDYASHNKTEQSGWLSDYSSSWDLGLDYFRLDGSSSVDNRATWCKSFNDVTNIRARLFLISTKAGGLGINLVAANRVIIFDVSWNPSHDIQSIFRVYRFGQTKPCYIYRFIAMGTMEEKVYERQVTKLAISKRVIDEQQIDRHYNQNDLNEIYQFTPMSEVERALPMVPKDRLLAETLQELPKQIFKYHEHDSLLEHKEDEELDEEERKAAWDEFENDKQQKPPPMMYYPQYNIANNFNNQLQMEIQNTSRALETMLRQRNPTWTELQIQQSIPILLQQVYQFAPGFQQRVFPQFGGQPGFAQPNTSMMQQQSEYNAAQ